MALSNKIERQPREQEIPQVIAAEMTAEGGPRGAAPEDVRDARHLARVLHSRSLAARHPLIPKRQPEETDQTQNHENYSPPEPRHQQPSGQNAQRRTALGARIGQR